MKQKFFIKWITAAGIVGVLFGIFYAVFGLQGLPIYQKFVPKASFDGWSRGLYGAAFVGFSVLLLFVGRRAIRKKDKELVNILLLGIASWLVFEAIVSLVYKVYINVAVDMVLLTFLSLPLLKSTRNM